MKRYLVLLIFAILMLILTSCKSGNYSNDTIEARKLINLKLIYGGVDIGDGNTSGALYVDSTTGVIYVITYGTYKSGLSPIYNADGTLKTWEME